MKKFIVLVLIVIAAGAGGYALKSNNKPAANTNSPNSPNYSSSAPVSSGATADYSNKGLSSFPKEVLKNTSVTVLNLSNNNLTGALPAEIHNLTKLEQLDVSNNNMTGIPAEVGQLRNLKVLNYANNKITGLPLELGNLTQLQVLDLSGNNPRAQDLSQIRAKLARTEIRL